MKRALVFKKMSNSLIVPYDLSKQLGIIKIMCHEKEGAKIGQVSADEDDLEGVELDEEEEKPNRDHLLPEMRKIAKKFPKVLKDSLRNANGFKNQPHKELDINHAVPPSTTPMSG